MATKFLPWLRKDDDLCCVRSVEPGLTNSCTRLRIAYSVELHGENPCGGVCGHPHYMETYILVF